MTNIFKYAGIILLLVSTGCNAQNTSKETDKVENAVYSYLQNARDLVPELENPNSYYYIVEVVENKVFGFNDIGVYRIGANKSPSEVYVLIYEKVNYEILDLRQFAYSMDQVASFFVRNKIDNSRAYDYLSEILKIYKKNDYYNPIKM
jgi:hypothetical protein